MSGLREPFGQTPEQTRNFSLHGSQSQSSDVNIRTCPEEQYEVGRNRVLGYCAAERRTFFACCLAHQSSNAISLNSIEPPAGNRIPYMQGGLFRALEAIGTGQKRTTDFSATFEHAVKSRAAPERLGLLHLPFVADCKLLTASCTPPCKHLAAGLRGHARAEAVSIPALAVMRLKRPLHSVPSLL
jgi:hypothetical protein